MRVLHVMPNVSRAFGGPTESLIGYAQAAQTQGGQVHVAAPSVALKDRQWLNEQLPDVVFHFFPSVGRHAWVIAPGLWHWLWSEGTSYDAIHTHGLFNPVSSLSARIAISRRNPVVMRPFGTLSRYTFSRRTVLKRLYFRLLDRPSLQAASGIHFTTNAERDEAARLDLSLDDRSHVVPPPWRGDTTAVDFDAKSERPTVLFMSRLHPKKNISSLINAWSAVIDAVPDAQLWIAGDGKEAFVTELQDRVDALGLEECISFLGFLSGDDKARVLREAWMFALPSHQENFGVAVLEAVAHGLPVVISPEVQLADFVKNENVGVVTSRDSDAIAKAISGLLKDQLRRQQMARRGPKVVHNTFGLERVGQQLISMYHTVHRHG